MGFQLVHTEVVEMEGGFFRHTFYDTGDGSCLAFFDIHGVGEQPDWDARYFHRQRPSRVGEPRGVLGHGGEAERGQGAHGAGRGQAAHGGRPRLVPLAGLRRSQRDHGRVLPRTRPASCPTTRRPRACCTPPAPTATRRPSSPERQAVACRGPEALGRAHAASARSPEGRVERSDRVDHVRPALRARARPGRRAGHRHRHARRLVDGVRPRPRRAPALRRRLRALPESEARLDPQLRELGQTRVGWARGQSVRVLPALQVVSAIGMSETKIAAIPAWSVATCFDATSARCSPTPTPSCTTAAGWPTACSTSCGPTSPTRRSSSSRTSPRSTRCTPPSPRAAGRVRRPRRAHRRGRRSRGRLRARRRPQHQPAE